MTIAVRKVEHEMRDQIMQTLKKVCTFRKVSILILQAVLNFNI